MLISNIEPCRREYRASDQFKTFLVTAVENSSKGLIYAGNAILNSYSLRLDRQFALVNGWNKIQREQPIAEFDNSVAFFVTLGDFQFEMGSKSGSGFLPAFKGLQGRAAIEPCLRMMTEKS